MSNEIGPYNSVNLPVLRNSWVTQCLIRVPAAASEDLHGALVPLRARLIDNPIVVGFHIGEVRPATAENDQILGLAVAAHSPHVLERLRDRGIGLLKFASTQDLFEG